MRICPPVRKISLLLKAGFKGFQSAAWTLLRQGDDRSAIVRRQGRKVRLLAVYRNLDTVEVAHRVAEFIESEKPSAVVIDTTGLGVGTVDELKHCGYRRYVHEFMAGGKADDPAAHANSVLSLGR